MNPLPREALCRILQQNGPALAAEPARCEALLRDLCGQYRKELFVLVAAARVRIPADLKAAGDMPELVVAKATTRLVEELGFREDVARWAVLSWALALGVVDPAGVERLSAPAAVEESNPAKSGEDAKKTPEPKSGPEEKAVPAARTWTWAVLLFAFLSVLLAIHPGLWLAAAAAGAVGWLAVRSRPAPAAAAGSGWQERMLIVLPVIGILTSGGGALFIHQTQQAARAQLKRASAREEEARREREQAEELRRQADLERKRAHPFTVRTSGASPYLPTAFLHPTYDNLRYPAGKIYVFAVLDNGLYGVEDNTVQAEIQLSGPESFGPWTESAYLIPASEEQALMYASWSVRLGRTSFLPGSYHYTVKINGTAVSSGDFTVGL